MLQIRQQGTVRAGAFWWLWNTWIMRCSLASAKLKGGILWITPWSLGLTQSIAHREQIQLWGCSCSLGNRAVEFRLCPSRGLKWIIGNGSSSSREWWHPRGLGSPSGPWGYGEQGRAGWDGALPSAASRSIQNKTPKDLELQQQQEPVSVREKKLEKYEKCVSKKTQNHSSNAWGHQWLLEGAGGVADKFPLLSTLLTQYKWHISLLKSHYIPIPSPPTSPGWC